MKDASEPPTLKERAEELLTLSVGVTFLVVVETCAWVFGRERVLKQVNRVRMKLQEKE